MKNLTNQKLEELAQQITKSAVYVDGDDCAGHNLSVEIAEALRACKVQRSVSFEEGLKEALKCIASIGLGKNRYAEEGHQDAYRAVETYLADWKAGKSDAYRAEVNRLLKEAATLPPMTPEQIREQKISFVYGQLMDAAPHITKEEIAAELDKLEGLTPKPPAC